MVDHTNESAQAGLVPGTFVRHKTESAWGLGQVQSSLPGRVTVNFEHAGKVLVSDVSLLVAVAQDDIE